MAGSNRAASSGAKPPSNPPRHVHLDGRTLEGGGQLVRIALGLSALTGRAVTIDHVRGNRGRKSGLKASHAAAVKLLAEISGSRVSNGDVGSTCVTFKPPHASVEEDGSSSAQTLPAQNVPLVSLNSLSVQSKYDIRLKTPGSIFLIFQALYPYLLHVGLGAPAEYITVNIVGGTNGSGAPSYDYAAQVMAPNFARLGLPPFSMTLHKRGWTTGTIEMGKLSFSIHPLPASNPQQHAQGSQISRFPRINIMDYERGKITRVVVTILAPKETLNEYDENGKALTVANHVEQETLRRLRKALKKLDTSVLGGSPGLDSALPIIDLTPTEITSHLSRLYILLVAHTSTGFRIGHDALLGDEHGRNSREQKPRKNQKQKTKHERSSKKHTSEALVERISDMIDICVEGFIEELLATHDDAPTDSQDGSTGSALLKRSCLDCHMRDQIVVFEALGNLGEKVGTATEEAIKASEDERYWTLHTQTAQWVCQKMLQVDGPAD